jgi:hypothetical protein
MDYRDCHVFGRHRAMVTISINGICCAASLDGEILMLTSSRYLMNNGPIHCMFCREPFHRRDGFVEFWRTGSGDHFCSEFCADDAEEALFKKRHTAPTIELPHW